MPPEPAYIVPAWGAPGSVRALMSTRRGGDSLPPFDGFNLALHPADPAAAANRRRFAADLGASPRWLHQVHGTGVARLGPDAPDVPPQADAAVTRDEGVACAVMVADCLPVLLCAGDGLGVGAAHAGWRGLASGVLERSVAALAELTGCDRTAIQAWLGPCIGPRRFEVGADVLTAFGRDPASVDDAGFRRADRADGSHRWLADLRALARARLSHAGVQRVFEDPRCTVEEASTFFSFRRDGAAGPTGRMAAAIVLRRGR